MAFRRKGRPSPSALLVFTLLSSLSVLSSCFSPSLHRVSWATRPSSSLQLSLSSGGGGFWKSINESYRKRRNRRRMKATEQGKDQTDVKKLPKQVIISDYPEYLEKIDRIRGYRRKLSRRHFLNTTGLDDIEAPAELFSHPQTELSLWNDTMSRFFDASEL